MGRHFSFLLSLAFPISDELVCVSFCTEQLSFCAVLSDCCASSVILTHNIRLRSLSKIQKTSVCRTNRTGPKYIIVQFCPLENQTKGSSLFYAIITNVDILAELARSCTKEKTDSIKFVLYSCNKNYK